MYEIFGKTDTGLKRDHNEDHFLLQKAVICAGEIGTEAAGGFVVAVADGMGGENAGETAARLALSALSIARPDATQNDLRAIITGAHRLILDYGAAHPEATNLGTTLAGISCDDDRVISFHVGDSRVYRFRDGILKPITTDHSLVQVLFQSGEITREQMFAHPQKNIIMQSLGGTTGADKLDIAIQELRGVFAAGDIYIICSDGLTDMVEDDQIEEILKAHADLPAAVTALVAKGNENGGQDNITVVAVKRTEVGDGDAS